ncbi:MAG: ATP-binding protein [Methanomicrobiales archaeon]
MEMRVLFVSADPDLREAAERFLPEKGKIRLETAGDVGEAARLLRAGSYDLVITGGDSRILPLPPVTGARTLRAFFEGEAGGAEGCIFLAGSPEEAFGQLCRHIRTGGLSAETGIGGLIDWIPDPVLAIDRWGRVTVWNRALEDLTGVPAEDLLGKGGYAHAVPFYGHRRPILVDLVTEQDEEVLRRYYSVIRREEGLIIAETDFPRLHGERRVLWAKAAPLYDEQGEITGAIEVIRDVTELKETEEALHDSNRKLNLLCQVTRHDILNELMIASGYLELYRQEAHDRPDDMLARVDQALHEIQRQIEFTRDYEGLGESPPEWQDPVPLIDCCIAHEVPDGIRVAVTLSPVAIHADPMLGKVFCNLLRNAVQHGHGVTGITIDGETKTDGSLIITIEDDGCGIPKEEKGIIFDPAYGRRRGHGLFLVSEILDITGIGIRETGTAGEGARFELHVPPAAWRLAE